MISVLLLIFLIIFLVAIILVYLYVKTNASTQTTRTTSTIWKVTDSSSCTYKRATGSVSSGIYFRPTITYNNGSIINSKDQCVDFDTVYSKQITHTCNRQRCLYQNGEITTGSESLNVSCGLPPCGGNISLLSVDYNGSDANCMDTSFNYTSCDPVNQEQMWRITRDTKNNNLVQVYDRQDGKCLTAVKGTTTINPIGCNVSISNAWSLQLTTCGDEGNFENGYAWYITPNQTLAFVGNGTQVTYDELDTLTNPIVLLSSAGSVYAAPNGVCPGSGVIQTFDLNDQNMMNESYNKEVPCVITNSSGCIPSLHH